MAIFSQLTEKEKLGVFYIGKVTIWIGHILWLWFGN